MDVSVTERLIFAEPLAGLSYEFYDNRSARGKLGEVVDADGLLKIGHALRHLLETVLAKKLVLFLFKIFGHRIVFLCGDQTSEHRK
jgi:hypothetical protein